MACNLKNLEQTRISLNTKIIRQRREAMISVGSSREDGIRVSLVHEVLTTMPRKLMMIFVDRAVSTDYNVSNC